MVCDAPVIVKDAENEDSAKFALMRVAVMRADRLVEDGRDKNFCDVVKVMTKNPRLIADIQDQDIKMLDMVDIEGILATTNINKTARCMHCGGTMTTPGVIVYVQPKQVVKMMHVPDKNAAFQDLIKHRENSNQAQIAGTLCRDPKIGKTKSGIMNCQYIIASNKLYREAGDDPAATTNYPVVVEYGKNADDAYKHLKVNSSVLIDGCIQARRVQKHMVCPHCSKEFDWAEEVGEIIPYHTSYLTNYLSDDDVEEMKKEKLKRIKESIFGAPQT